MLLRMIKAVDKKHVFALWSVMKEDKDRRISGLKACEILLIICKMEGKVVLGIVRGSKVINRVQALGMELNWYEKLEWHSTSSEI